MTALPQREPLEALAAAMPKIDLHYHLEGGVRAETLSAITGDPDTEAIRRKLTVSPDCASLSEFLGKFDYISPLLQSPRALRLAARAAVQEAAEQKLCYLEVRFAPAYLATAEMDVEAAIAAVTEGLREGSREFGVPAEAIVSLGLTTPVEANLDIVRAALPWLGKGVTAIDAAGPEAEIPLETQAPALRLAQGLGFPLTLHAGEAAPPASIARAVELGAVRIGHGTSLWRDGALMERLAREKIGLEMCPTSNLQTKAIANWGEYHIREYFEAGVPLTICTDDPAISGITLTEEYLLAMSVLGFAPAEMERVVLGGVEMSFAPPALKETLRAKVRAGFTALSL